MPTTVECCLRNLERTARRRLAAETDANVIEKPCLQRCGECAHGRFVVIDGEFRWVAARTELCDVVEER